MGYEGEALSIIQWLSVVIMDGLLTSVLGWNWVLLELDFKCEVQCCIRYTCTLITVISKPGIMEGRVKEICLIIVSNDIELTFTIIGDFLAIPLKHSLPIQ